MPNISRDILRLATKGDATAQHKLGVTYINGLGVEKDQDQDQRILKGWCTRKNSRIVSDESGAHQGSGHKLTKILDFPFLM